MNQARLYDCFTRPQPEYECVKRGLRLAGYRLVLVEYPKTLLRTKIVMSLIVHLARVSFHASGL